jgi:hypothetical protein
LLASAAAGAQSNLVDVFRWVFACGGAFLVLSLVALLRMEERPLRGRSEGPPGNISGRG